MIRQPNVDDVNRRRRQITACGDDVNRAATVMRQWCRITDQSVVAENVDEMAHVCIVIAFQMNVIVDIADDEQWVGGRDDTIKNISQLTDKCRNRCRRRLVDQNHYARQFYERTTS